MGSTESKSQNAETATASKAGEQENGHVRTNGDAVQKLNGDTAAASNGSAEPIAEEAGSGETIEQAPPANGDAKPEEPPGKQGKKKKFSLKKPFKLQFRKNKKEASPAVEESPAVEAAASPKEDNVAKAEEPQNENVAEPTNAPDDASTAPAVAPEEVPAAQPEPAATPAEQSEPKPTTEPAAEPPKEE